MNQKNEIVIAGFGGSLRKESYGKKVLIKAASLMPEGSGLQIGDISKIPIFNSDNLKEPDRSVVEFKNLINSSDGFLIVTPEYNFSIPGFLKNAIDWASVPVNVFSKKIGAIMSYSSGMLGGSRAQYHLRQVFVFLDSRILAKPEVFINSVDKKIKEKGEFYDENAFKFMRDLLNNVVTEVRIQKSIKR